MIILNNDWIKIKLYWYHTFLNTYRHTDLETGNRFIAEGVALQTNIKKIIKYIRNSYKIKVYYKQTGGFNIFADYLQFNLENWYILSSVGTLK
jgi:hypothetical protein